MCKNRNDGDGSMHRTENVELTVVCLLEDGGKVLLFKAVEWAGTLTSSEEGEIKWVEYSQLPSLKTVDDLEEMLHMMNAPGLTEFQYLLCGGEWVVSIK